MVSTTEPVIQTAGVTKIFRDFWNREKVAAVNDLTLEIAPNEVFGLLGPNGSGKSTTVKMILGLLYPTRGVIRVLGEHPTHVKIKQRIGFLPEESYLYPFLTARETLDYYGRLFNQPRQVRRQRTDMLLEMLGLGAVAYRRVGEFSKGMQRRIGLAQALINDPDLLILDEPTSGLDPLGIRLFKDIIAQLAQRGKTVILCSHLLGDVEEVCDRVSILYGGRQRTSGRLSDLLSRQSLTKIVAERLSESTVNKIRQLISDSESKSVLEVSTPKDKLETLFLRIVSEAQSAHLQTGGAVATGKVADFLREGADGENVVAELIAAAAPAAQPVAVEIAEIDPAPAKVDEALLTGLTDAAATAEPAESPTPDPPPSEPSPADRGVIDSLLDTDRKDHDA